MPGALWKRFMRKPRNEPRLSKKNVSNNKMLKTKKWRPMMKVRGVSRSNSRSLPTKMMVQLSTPLWGCFLQKAKTTTV